MIDTGKAVEPMGFVMDRYCPEVEYGPEAEPFGGEVHLFVVEEKIGPFAMRRCKGRKFRIVAVFNVQVEKPDQYPSMTGAGGEPLDPARHPSFVCEHMGRLVE